MCRKCHFKVIVSFFLLASTCMTKFSCAERAHAVFPFLGSFENPGTVEKLGPMSILVHFSMHKRTWSTRGRRKPSNGGGLCSVMSWRSSAGRASASFSKRWVASLAGVANPTKAVSPTLLSRRIGS